VLPVPCHPTKIGSRCRRYHIATAARRPWRATPRPGGGRDVGPSPERRYAVR